MEKLSDGFANGDGNEVVVASEPDGCAVVPNFEFEAKGLEADCPPFWDLEAPKGFVEDCVVVEDGAPKTLGILDGVPKPLNGGFEDGAPKGLAMFEVTPKALDGEFGDGAPKTL